MLFRSSSFKDFVVASISSKLFLSLSAPKFFSSTDSANTLVTITLSINLEFLRNYQIELEEQRFGKELDVYTNRIQNFEYTKTFTSQYKDEQLTFYRKLIYYVIFTSNLIYFIFDILNNFIII